MPARLIPQGSPTPLVLIQLCGLVGKAVSDFSKLSNSLSSHEQETASNGCRLNESGEGSCGGVRQWQCTLCASLHRADDDEHTATTKAQELPPLQHVCNTTRGVVTPIWDKQGRRPYTARVGFSNPRTITAFKKTGPPPHHSQIQPSQ